MTPNIDYHTHPQGHAVRPYTLELLTPWVERCRQQRIVSIAFTDHDRYHSGVSFSVIEQLRAANPDVEILIGIELDNDPVTAPSGLRWVQENWPQLDCVLGSVHYFPGESRMFDGSDQALQLQSRGPNAAFELYLLELHKLIARGSIDCLSHLDLVKIHKLFPSEYDPLVWFNPVLDQVQSAGLALEINTAGWRKPVGEQYPQADIIREAVRRQIPITVSSDAHSFAQVGEDYERLAVVMAEAGVKKLTRFWRHEKKHSALSIEH
jgi:histidinol-phosphatase (PHP family)